MSQATIGSGIIVKGVTMNWIDAVGYLAALAALVFFTLQIWQQQRLYKMESKMRGEELDISRERLERELQAMDQYRSTAATLATEIGNVLVRDPVWAVDALATARVSGSAYSVFGNRITHFQGEKRFLAETLVALVEARARAAFEHDSASGIIAVIDSGTTLYPLFELLAAECVEHFEDEWHWTHRLLLVTNNIPGIEALIRHGRTRGDTGHERLAVSCKVLPGKPLPAYAAIVGSDTEAALRDLENTNVANLIRFETSQENLRWRVLGLTTGNWITVRDGVVHPLARGEGHLDFKRELVRAAHEIYVVGPLGKMFLEVEVEEVNAALNYSAASRIPGRQAYSEVPIEDAGGPIRLVTTCRQDTQYILQPHSERLVGALGGMARIAQGIGVEYASLGSEVEQLHHLMVPYSRLPRDPATQLEIEFPHPGTRRGAFLEEFFGVSI